MHASYAAKMPVQLDPEFKQEMDQKIDQGLEKFADFLDDVSFTVKEWTQERKNKKNTRRKNKRKTDDTIFGTYIKQPITSLHDTVSDYMFKKSVRWHIKRAFKKFKRYQSKIIAGAAVLAFVGVSLHQLQGAEQLQGFRI